MYLENDIPEIDLFACQDNIYSDSKMLKYTLPDVYG